MPRSPRRVVSGELARVPGDGTQPAWTTRDIGLAKQAPGNVFNVSGDLAAHAIIMNSPETIAHVAAVLGIP